MCAFSIVVSHQLSEHLSVFPMINLLNNIHILPIHCWLICKLCFLIELGCDRREEGRGGGGEGVASDNWHGTLKKIFPIINVLQKINLDSKKKRKRCAMFWNMCFRTIFFMSKVFIWSLLGFGHFFEWKFILKWILKWIQTLILKIIFLVIWFCIPGSFFSTGKNSETIIWNLFWTHLVNTNYVWNVW